MGAPSSVEHSRIVFFDGVCNLCNSSVLFIIKRDPNARFKFATLQSDFARAQLSATGANPEKLDSIVLLWKGRFFYQSSAALKIASELSGLWPALYVLMVVPPFIRNAVYNWIARNRYRFFGKKDACMIPTPALKARFID